MGSTSNTGPQSLLRTTLVPVRTNFGARLQRVMAIGSVHGSLVIEAYRIGPAGGINYYECRCSCGSLSFPGKGNLEAGRSTRCPTCSAKASGAAQSKPPAPKPERVFKSDEYKYVRRVWRNMVARTTYPRKRRANQTYLARGITICDRWLEFENFYSDVVRLEGFGVYPVFDRRDNDLGYSPDNCRFVGYSESNSNTTRNIRYKQRRTEEQVCHPD